MVTVEELTLSPEGDSVTEELKAHAEKLRAEVDETQSFLSSISVEMARTAPSGALPVAERTLEYNNGDTYMGGTLGNFRHGKGVHTTNPAGDVYDGEWKYDVREGHGKMTFAHGLVYEGEWKQDKTWGQGRCTYPSGDEYEGEWKEDHRWGWGSYFSKETGAVYEGQWHDDVKEGKGRNTYPDGSFYQGEFGNGEEVKGRFVSAGGEYEYDGEWRGGEPHGQGRSILKDLHSIYVDGSKYEGEWREGHRHGKGTHTTPEDVYEGQWCRGNLEGEGKYRHLHTGEVYTGGFKDGERHGAGKCVFASGDKYDGEWEGGKRNGRGVCRYASGDVYEGEWARGLRHGYGMCKWADGTKFRGEWEDDAWVQSTAVRPSIPTDPSRCRARGPGLARGVAGRDSLLTITARDELGNARLSGGDACAGKTSKIAVSLGFLPFSPVSPYLAGLSTILPFSPVSPPPPSSRRPPRRRGRGRGSRGRGGQRRRDVRRAVALRSGMHMLSLTTPGGEHVAESPYPIKVLPGPPVPCKCVPAAPKEAWARVACGAEAEFVVQVRDAFGNDAIQGGMQIDAAVSVAVGHGEVGAQVTDRGDGRYAVTYRLPSEGFYRLELSSGGRPVAGGIFSVEAAPPIELAAEPASPRAGEEEEEAGGREARVPPPTVPDLVQVWENISKAAFAQDGQEEGWDSDEDEVFETKEEKWRREHPDVPVVDNLEDIWKVGRYQKEKKEADRRAKEKRRAALKAKLDAMYGAGPAPAPPPAEPTGPEAAGEDAALSGGGGEDAGGRDMAALAQKWEGFD